MIAESNYCSESCVCRSERRLRKGERQSAELSSKTIQQNVSFRCKAGPLKNLCPSRLLFSFLTLNNLHLLTSLKWPRTFLTATHRKNSSVHRSASHLQIDKFSRQNIYFLKVCFLNVFEYFVSICTSRNY